LVLGTATRIVGRTRDADGEPLIAKVGIKRLHLSQDTDRDGRFVLGPLRPGDEMVQADAAGNRAVSRLGSLHSRDNQGELVFPPRPLHRISGRLVDPRGTALAEQELELVGTTYHDDRWTADTDPEGGFLFEGVPDGEYDLWPRSRAADGHPLDPAV